MPRKKNRVESGTVVSDYGADEQQDAITYLPLDPQKSVQIRSPDGTLVFRYNISTLIHIAKEKGRYLQPPHFREPLVAELRDEMELKWGKDLPAVSESRAAEHQHNNVGDDVFLPEEPQYWLHVGLYEEEEMIAGDEEGDMNNPHGHRIRNLEALMQLNYILEKRNVTVCPVCFEAARKRLCSRIGIRFTEESKWRSVISPVDVATSLHPREELPFVVFPSAATWRAHVRKFHGYEEGSNADDHSLRQKVHDYIARKNSNKFDQEKFHMAQQTSQRFWNRDMRFNVMRYNRIFRQVNQFAAEFATTKEKQNKHSETLVFEEEEVTNAVAAATAEDNDEKENSEEDEDEEDGSDEEEDSEAEVENYLKELKKRQKQRKHCSDSGDDDDDDDGNSFLASSSGEDGNFTSTDGESTTNDDSETNQNQRTKRGKKKNSSSAESSTSTSQEADELGSDSNKKKQQPKTKQQNLRQTRLVDRKEVPTSTGGGLTSFERKMLHKWEVQEGPEEFHVVNRSLKVQKVTTPNKKKKRNRSQNSSDTSSSSQPTDNDEHESGGKRFPQSEDPTPYKWITQLQAEKEAEASKKELEAFMVESSSDDDDGEKEKATKKQQKDEEVELEVSEPFQWREQLKQEKSAEKTAAPKRRILCDDDEDNETPPAAAVTTTAVLSRKPTAVEPARNIANEKVPKSEKKKATTTAQRRLLCDEDDDDD